MALSYIDEYTDWHDITMASGYTRNTIQGQMHYRVEPNSDKSAYNLSVWTRLRTRYTFNWAGQGNLSVVITWTGTDGSTKKYSNSMQTSTPLRISQTSTDYQVTDWNGPLQFNGITATGVKSLNFNVDLDFLRTTCSVCYEDGVSPAGKGPGVASSSWDHTESGYDHDHYQHFYDTRTVSVEDIPLLYPSVLSSIANTNKYNNSAGISAATNSISLSWSLSGLAGTSYYKVGSGSWTATSSTTSATISGLSAGTSYTIQVKNVNEAGDSNILSITVRTRHNAPVIDLTYSSAALESLTFSWTSDKSLQSTEYKIDSGSWTNLKMTGTSGTFAVDGFSPNTSHTIYVRGVSTSTYDSLSSNEDSASGTTLDMARITSVGDCIFGNNISVTIKHVATSNTAKLKIWTSGNSRTPSFEFTVTNGTYTFSPTQTQLDDMYKCYTTTNSVPIYFQVYTVGTQNWTDTRQDKSLQLTGIAKTMHIGISNSPRRAQGFIGVSNSPRRVVAWVGDANGKPRRCI